MNHFAPCSGCSRHVRAGDAACPFCGEALPLMAPSASTAVPARRLGRAATLAFGAALAAGAATGCDGGAVPAYGGPAPEDAGSGQVQDAGSPISPDGGGVAPAYGAPPGDGT